ncbi:hypothetical protein [Mucilaginibacter sp. PPCGB 2223]|nr:hypothetical protein [Mucilaginibacter sp. PPCGB 2223]
MNYNYNKQGVAYGPHYPCPSGRRALILHKALAARPVSLSADRQALLSLT